MPAKKSSCILPILSLITFITSIYGTAEARPANLLNISEIFEKKCNK